MKTDLPREDARSTAHRKPSSYLIAAWMGALLCVSQTSIAAETAVSARLEIPAAETHVIGDPIPLFWHFTNSTPRPLAFTWEACCRLNGRLNIRKDGVDLPPIPPGPNSAHQFAKPAIIRAQSEQGFESQLADWVFLTNSGRYEISGRYIGVLPEQRPPVPPTIALWRGEAATAPATVTLVSVPDYLAQRTARVARSGLDAAVAGPDRLPALGEIPLTVNVTNTGSAPLNFRWPLEAELWFIDEGGMRVPRAPVSPSGDDAVVTLPPNGVWSRAFPVSAADLAGARLGDYRVFIDFVATTNGRPRAAARPHPIRWALGSAEVATLLNAAASGSAVGARNAPLRVLRQYLGAIEGTLSGLDAAALGSKVADLRKQLLTAAQLRALPLRTGVADLGITIQPGGSWSFGEPLVARAVTGSSTQQLATVMAVRRHLGIEVAARLQPADLATVRDLAGVSEGLSRAAPELATAPRFMASAPTNMVAGTVTIQPAAVAANFILRLQRRADGALRVEVARALEAPGLVKPEALTSAPFASLADPAAITALVGDGKLAVVQALVLAPGETTWRELKPWIDPLLARGAQIDLVELR